METVQALNAAGFQLLCEDDAASALPYFEEALALAPESPILLNNRGNALVQLGRPEEAGEAYARAINANPTYPRPYCNLALLYQLADENEAAIALYRQYLQLAPGEL